MAAAAQQATASAVSAEEAALTKERQQKINAELSYYLERHSVVDEGYNMVARYADKGDSTLAMYMPMGALRPFNVGRWLNITRTGTGITHDCQGRFFIGTFDADTLVSGLRIDTSGVYAGRFKADGTAEGHGSYSTFDGTYYEGQWHQDQREGFGFGISPSYLHAGHWRRDRFIGERMHYTSDRIYGIDVSRYQHERGKKRFNIDWPRLRIVGLGHRISSQNVSGTVDYPVSFAYIKSTEGISIKNKYFMLDYIVARRNGVAVGAYHFFSTRQSAALQAAYFLQNSCFRHGDLPPMLDVEPTDAQVKAMGGPDVLFSQIRTWLKRVEAEVGIRPILYVNQRFVKKYLDLAADVKRDYQVWIARYGEYKPDVHLTFWQLSADGVVNGIRGEVDINVFNGYQSQWEDFLREETIKTPVRSKAQTGV